MRKQNKEYNNLKERLPKRKRKAQHIKINVYNVKSLYTKSKLKYMKDQSQKWRMYSIKLQT